jgi:hypothetical protein
MEQQKILSLAVQNSAETRYMYLFTETRFEKNASPKINI